MTRKYEDILNTWFYVLYPRKSGSVEAFEAEDGIEDRLKTADIFVKMLAEAPKTVAQVFEVDDFPLTLDAFSILDAHLTPQVANGWMQRSDPDHANNFFKLNVCELAVHLGTAAMNALEGRWRFSRFPNYFTSGVVVGQLEFSIFDSVIKKCSSDFGHESLHDKLAAFANLVHTAEYASKNPQ